MTELISTEYLLQVARGLIPGASLFTQIGKDKTINKSIFKDIWGALDNLFYPSSNETWEVVSTSPQDTAAGTGVRTVTIVSLSDDYTPNSTVTVTMNGTTPVVLPGGSIYFRKQGFFMASSGTLGQSSGSAGQITLQRSVIVQDRGSIGIGETTDASSHFTVPAGKTAFAIQTSVFVPKDNDASIRSKFTEGDSGVFLTGVTIDSFQNSVVVPSRSSRLLPEKSESLFQAISTNETASVVTVAEFVIYDNL